MKKTHDDSEIEDLLRKWRPETPTSAERFVDTVMRKVNDLPTPRPWWKFLFDFYRFELSLRPATVVALIFIFGIGIGYWMHRAPSSTPSATIATTENPVEPRGENRHMVKFVYMNPYARSVSVVGDFNNWQQTPMQRQNGGMWTLTVPIAGGDYNYQFVIDGNKFVADPAAPEKNDDGFGQTDSVLRL